MSKRLYIGAGHTMTQGATLALPASAVRHLQVWRMQPGQEVWVCTGEGGQCRSRIARMGRTTADVELIEAQPVEAELPFAVTLAVGMPANERMDTLVEKATELGAARIQPLACERSVLRLDGERALRRVAHWQGVAEAASEQCGRDRVPRVERVQALTQWLQTLDAPAGGQTRLVLQPGAQASLRQVLSTDLPRGGSVTLLSGPEGGLSDAESALAARHGFTPCSLGPRILRADTAPLAALAALNVLGAREGAARA